MERVAEQYPADVEVFATSKLRNALKRLAQRVLDREVLPELQNPKTSHLNRSKAYALAAVLTTLIALLGCAAEVAVNGEDSMVLDLVEGGRRWGWD